MIDTLERLPTEEIIRPEFETSTRIDFYKFTMSQFIYENNPAQEVCFRFKNRTDVPLGDYVDKDQLQARLRGIQETGFSQKELEYLSDILTPDGQTMFSSEYIDYIANTRLPDTSVEADENNDLHIEATGDWPIVSLWETIVLSEVNEMYNTSQIEDNNFQKAKVLVEGTKRLQEKISIINEYNASLPVDIQPLRLTDFGTRRHFSPDWQHFVTFKMNEELPDDVFIGTSNVYMAREYNLQPIGTFAHELTMVYAAMNADNDESLRNSQKELLEKWYNKYPSLSIALSDTFGHDAFFEDFSELEDSDEWMGMRHDSGDPFEFGERVIEYYQGRGIDPKEKLIVFSDGLEIEKIIDLHRKFGERIKLAFGWGSNLTNDLGIESLSIVMKAVRVDDVDTVKLSEVLGKAQGETADIDRYVRVFGHNVRQTIFEVPKY